MTRSRQTADWGSRAGLAKVIPSSVAVGSGTGSADTTGKVTFTSASSVSLNSVFSSNYDNYEIVFTLVHNSTQDRLRFRLRASGTDASGTDYHFEEVVSAGTTISGLRISTTSFDAGGISQTNQCTSKITLFRPFATVNTSIQVFNVDNNGTTTHRFFNFGGYHNQTVSYDGFTFFPTTGTVTGIVSVYGYN